MLMSIRNEAADTNGSSITLTGWIAVKIAWIRRFRRYLIFRRIRFGTMTVLESYRRPGNKILTAGIQRTTSSI
ncbi:hypothetical protein [Paenibacillus wynnii]|uniref:hypothetical protein n=1 Tax=Paenibacillus wynnii TaxID=268407 RepID=UPI001F0A8C30|nr:hypothetical protein [Paenibacillus wynnii]